MLQVKIINKSKHTIPAYETAFSAGMDIRANTGSGIIIRPMERRLIPTGLYIELPPGYEAQVRPRSGLALKNGISILNSPGTIDADYRGEIQVLLINFSTENFVINDGDRIAQMVVASCIQVNWDEVKILTDTLRGTGGYGHTGL
ncbi:MAG: dUTP diphosphatase [Flavobacterium sp.]|nr:dUTP diphosphatase [Pedobacter sp.]